MALTSNRVSNLRYDVVKYLVIQQLVDNTDYIIAMKEYLFDNISPSVICYNYSLNKFTLRGKIQRLVVKSNNNFRLAAEIFKEVYPYLLTVEPVIIKSNSSAYCTLCNRYINIHDTSYHIRKKHKDVIERTVSKIIARLVG